jgi:glc operon protein GlcG
VKSVVINQENLTMYQAYHVAHADALRILTTIQAELEKNHKGAAIAVADTQGEIIAFLRTDGCKLPSIQIAINKAFTAAREQKETKTIGQSSQEKPFPMTFGDLRYTAWGGGIPIIYNGQVVGAVGVSGLSEAEDMVLARMGTELID